MTLRGGGGGLYVNVTMTLIFPNVVWTSPLISSFVRACVIVRGEWSGGGGGGGAAIGPRGRHFI